MLTSKPLLERAFELAREDDCRRWQEVAQRLIDEGYELVHDYFSSHSLRRDIDVASGKSKNGRPVETGRQNGFPSAAAAANGPGRHGA